MQKSSGTGGGVMDPVPEHVVEVCNLDRETVCIKGVLIQKRDFKTVFYMAQALPEHCHYKLINSAKNMFEELLRCVPLLN